MPPVTETWYFNRRPVILLENVLKGSIELHVLTNLFYFHFIYNSAHKMITKETKIEQLVIMWDSQRKSNKMQQCIEILFHIHMKLNMFRATHRPSSRG
jgi:hypothetical protein